MSRAGRFVVTGGAGLIGSHIVELLVKADAREVIVLDNFVRGRMENLREALGGRTVTIVEGDVRDRALVAEVVKGIDVVFHQAAIRITQCASEPRLALEVLVDGTFNVVEAAANAGVRKVVAASSASVYGLAETFPTSERHHAYDNRTIYGAAKLFNEGLLRSFHETHGLDYVALRYFNVYGPRMDIHGAYTEVFVRWIDAISQGQPPVIFGDGTQTMDFVYVEDVARANLLAAQAPVTDDVFNIASGVETSLNTLAATLLELLGSNLRPEYQPARKVNPVPRRLADVRQARERLDFEARVPLRQGLSRFIRWWEKERCAVQA